MGVKVVPGFLPAGFAALYNGERLRRRMRMLRITGIAITIVLAAAVIAPRAALAWSEQSVPLNQDGTSKFGDPDAQLDRMSGSSSDTGGDRGRSSSFGSQKDGGSGWSFSITPQSSSGPSPFGPMFAPGWPDQRR
jgi:hypothetical protein